jgi:proline iminopeptidase
MPLYPTSNPNKTGFLKVSNLHTIYWAEGGNPDGLPVVFVHGGPGGGTEESDRGYFDPAVYRSVLFDQRGCGKSTPPAELEENTTWHLVSDMEKLREELNIDKWIVFGGSWGSTLALAYAEKHPDRCIGLILRGIFTLRRKELLWFYQEGADFLFPDFFEDYKAQIPHTEQGDLMSAYYKRLTGDNEQEKLACAGAWVSLLSMYRDP